MRCVVNLNLNSEKESLAYIVVLGRRPNYQPLGQEACQQSHIVWDPSGTHLATAVAIAATAAMTATLAAVAISQAIRSTGSSSSSIGRGI